jgi:hypothetical protein
MGWKNVRETTIWKGRVMRTGIFGTPPGQDVDLMPNEPTPDPEHVTDDALALLEVMKAKGWTVKLHLFTDKQWMVVLRWNEDNPILVTNFLRAAIVQAVLKAEGKL